jgi:hypothetical protein
MIKSLVLCAVAGLIASTVPAFPQQGLTDKEIAAYRKLAKELDPWGNDPKKVAAKLNACRASPRSLIGLLKADLVAKCGLAYHPSTMVSASSTSGVLQYEGFRVFLTNDIVTMASVE